MQTPYETAPTENPWQLGPTASRIARWVFGFGFFSVHLGVFLLGGLTLLMINLYRSPEDLWVGGPLLRWGVIVVLHLLGAIVTWAIVTALDAAEATKRENAGYEPRRPVAPVPPPVVTVSHEPIPAPVVPRLRFQPALSTPVEAGDSSDNRRFAFRGWKNEPETPPQRPSPTGWSVMRSNDTMPATVAPASTATWNPPAAVQVSAPPQQAPVIEQPPAAPDDAPATDNRWTWVEAAAEAWLAHRNDPADRPVSKPAAANSAIDDETER